MRNLIAVLFFFGTTSYARVDIKDTVPVPFPRLMDGSLGGSPGVVPARAPQAMNSQQWLESTALFKNARKLDEKMKANVKLGEDEKTQHEFSAKISTLEAKAQMVYKGWTHAEMVYESKGSETGFEISEKVLTNKELVLGHYTNPTRTLSSVGLRWYWK